MIAQKEIAERAELERISAFIAAIAECDNSGNVDIREGQRLLMCGDGVDYWQTMIDIPAYMVARLVRLAEHGLKTLPNETGGAFTHDMAFCELSEITRNGVTHYD